MKSKNLIICVVGLISLYATALALPPGMTAKPAIPAETYGTDTETMIDVNNLQMFVTNKGGFAEDWQLLLETVKNDGLYFPAGEKKTVLFSAGFWVGGLVWDPDSSKYDIRLAVGAFDTPEYFVGPADEDGNAQDDKWRYRIYKLRRDSSAWLNEDKGGILLNDKTTPYIRLDSSRHFNDYSIYLDSAAIDGAPVDSAGNPFLIGDQMLWGVFNDGGLHNYAAYGGGTDPLGVEIQSTFWGYDLPGALGNTIFAKWIVINKSDNQIDSAYVSLWADPDLGGASDDFVGCDTSLSLGYCYNATNNDNEYGSTPPAVGFDFLQGVIIREGDPIYDDPTWDWDTLVVILNTGDTIPNAIKLGMESFNKYKNGTDPDVPSEAYGYMQGIDAKETGLPYEDPETGEITKYFGAGDPVTGEGWNDSSPADRRYMLSTGPFTFFPNDTQVIVAAILVGQAGDRLASVTALKFYDELAQYAYDVNFNLPSPPPRPIVTSKAYDKKVVLTWTTRSEDEYDEPKHEFEGYVVYQGETVSGPWKRITTFDINNGYGQLRDDVLDPDLGAVVNIPVAFGTDEGVQHYIEITEDAINGGRLHNGIDYFYAVNAYSYSFDDPTVPRGLRVLENRPQAILVTPQGDIPGTEWASAESDLQATKSRIDPDQAPTTDLVTIQIVDPEEVTGHDYEVRYRDIYPDTLYDTLSLDPMTIDTQYIWPDTTDLLQDGKLVNIHKYWELWDVTDSIRLLEKQWNKSGDDYYIIVDGLLVKLIGEHEPAFQSVTYINNNTAHDPPFVGVGAGYDYFGGGVDYGWNFWGGYLDPAITDSFTTIEIRFTGDNLDNGQRAYNYLRGGTPNYGYQGYFQVPFQAWDATNDRQVNVTFVEWNGSDVYDSTWMPSAAGDGGREYLLPLKSDYSGDDPADATNSDIDYTTEDFFDGSNFDFLYAAWLALADEESVVDSGDVLQFLYANPGDENDVFSFSTGSAVTGDRTRAENALKDIKVVPNPYYAYSRYETDQFDRQVRFMGVPDKYTIRIFNLAGDKVRTLTSDEKTPGYSWAKWDLKTDQGLYVAPGVYIWYLETPDIGSTYGKMAIFPEGEQLQVY